MSKMRFISTVVFMAFVVSMSVGCKSKGAKARGGQGNDMLNPVVGVGIDGESLGYRDDDISLYGEGTFAPVYFDYDSSMVGSGERSKIEAVHSALRSNAQAGVIVEGHCDERGSREYNLALGERRALAVRAYLIGLGLDAARVQTKSMGEEQPAVFGHDESAWSKNRRVEFILFQ